jgi:tetratricopeptide (TPR) repeat protein
MESCAQVERKPLSILDSSKHHTYTGIVMMNQGKLDDASREFDLARELNQQEVKSFAGTALIKAYQGDFESAFEYMAKADQYAVKKEDRLFVHIGKIRLYTMSRSKKNWISEARKEFESAVAISPESSAAYFFMGLALEKNFDFDDAGILFAKVLDMNNEYVEEADREWKLIKKILDVNPETLTGKRIAIVDTATRAEIAALLVEELQLDELYKGLGIQNEHLSPANIVLQKEAHSYQKAIDTVLAIGVKGLERYPDGRFYPYDLVTKAVLAVIIIDIIDKIAGDSYLLDIPEGNEFLYRNLSSDLPFYKEIISVLSLGIMDAEVLAATRLAPYEPVSGVEVLLAFKRLKKLFLNL